MTRREQIIQQVVSLLTSPSIAGVPVYRSRIEALNPYDSGGSLAHPLSILVAPESDQRGDIENLQTQRTLNLNVAVLSVGDEPDSLADAVIDEIFRRLSRDQSLSGKCTKIRETETTFDFVQIGMDNCLITMKFAIAYLTNTNDLSLE